MADQDPLHLGAGEGDPSGLGGEEPASGGGALGTIALADQLLCARCGKPIRAEAAFCGTCGHARDAAPTSAALTAADAAFIAAVVYGLVLASNVLDFGALVYGWEGLGWTEVVMVIVAAAASIVLGRRSVLAWLRLPRLELSGLVQAAAGLGVAFASAKALGLVVDMSDVQMLSEFRGQPGGLVSALLVIAGFVPLLEEWLFRGVILECLLVLFPVRAAVVATALLFAILHLSPQTVVHHGLAGYVCGRVRVGSGSLWPAIACHALYNALVVLSVW